MKILFVVSRPIEINTSASIRNHATIKGLIKNGHDVTIVSSKPDKNHPLYDGSLHIEKTELKYFNIGSAQLVAKIGRRFKVLSSVRSYIYRVIYGNDIYDNLKSIVNFVNEINIKEYDLIISSSDPKSSHLFVDKLFGSNSMKIPWIQIWGDPFADDITRSSTGKTSKVIEEENRLLSLADKIIYVSKMTCEAQKLKYPNNEKKMFYEPIPYWRERRISKIIPLDYKNIKICYCGDYNSHIRDIKPLYNAINKLNIALTVCGMSDLNLQSTNNINIMPRQRSEVIKKIEAEADVLVHLSNLSGTQIPGKIYQYVSTDKVILFILDGEKEKLKNMFEEYERFIFVDNDKDLIIHTLQNIFELIHNVKNEPVEQFKAEYVSLDIIKL